MANTALEKLLILSFTQTEEQIMENTTVYVVIEHVRMKQYKYKCYY